MMLTPIEGILSGWAIGAATGLVWGRTLWRHRRTPHRDIRYPDELFDPLLDADRSPADFEG